MIPYIGGKFYMSDWVISKFPDNYEKLNYIEVFGGGGWILFHKNKSKLEVYNDIKKELVNLFLTIRDDYDEFKKRCEWTFHSREMHKIAIQKLKDNDFKDNIDYAVQTAIRYVMSINGNGGWAYATKIGRFFNWNTFINRLENIKNRLRHVQIENKDWRYILDNYDCENALFYLDPPYMIEAANEYYNCDWTIDDHKELSDKLKNIKGKFLLSYYENEYLREWYKNFVWYKKEFAKYSQKVKEKKDKGEEILICNYDVSKHDDLF